MTAHDLDTVVAGLDFGLGVAAGFAVVGGLVYALLALAAAIGHALRWHVHRPLVRAYRRRVVARDAKRLADERDRAAAMHRHPAARAQRATGNRLS